VVLSLLRMETLTRSLTRYSYNLVTPREQIRHASGLKVKESEVDGRDLFPRNVKYHLPVFIIFVSTLELVLFLVNAIQLTEDCQAVTWQGPLPMCSALIYNPYRRWEAWRFLTYSLSHVGYIHIISNITVQLALGIPLEIVHGSLSVAVIYIVGILSGSLATSLTDPEVFLAGSSGGVYALMLAHFPTLILNYKEMKSIVEWLVPVLVFVVGIVDLAIAVTARYSESSGGSVGYSAHIGGSLAGFLIGINIIRNLRHKKWEGYLRLICFLIWILLVIISILWNALATPFFPTSDWSQIPEDACNTGPSTSGC